MNQCQSSLGLLKKRSGLMVNFKKLCTYKSTNDGGESRIVWGKGPQFDLRAKGTRREDGVLDLRDIDGAESFQHLEVAGKSRQLPPVSFSTTFVSSHSPQALFIIFLPSTRTQKGLSKSV